MKREEEQEEEEGEDSGVMPDQDAEEDSLSATTAVPAMSSPTEASAAAPTCSADDLHVDPFFHRLRLSSAQWLCTCVLGAVLFPLRLAAVLACVVVAWALCSVATAGLSEEALAKEPMLGWRRLLRRASMFLGRRCTNAAGFAWVKVRGRRASPEEAPVLVAAPHSTFFDGFVAFWCGSPYLVSRKENRAIPFLGKCIECAQVRMQLSATKLPKTYSKTYSLPRQALFVSREDPASRQNTVKEILRRSAPKEPETGEGQGWPQLVIFPEGSTANRKALMSFKPGAFYPGRPVQPVLIRYPNKLDTVTW